ncbi:MAG: O-antigen ligase family protein [Thermoanaerobaculum sp.]|nr:O-antigen ligase family protein [Thermoanaerobaculum sp.]MDW7967445.1 O-antigen ligase family protein [Thermoanaerobaculum sp.]
MNRGETWRQKAIALAGLLLVLVVPLLVDLAMPSPFRAPKSLAAHFLWATLAGLFLLRPHWDGWFAPAAAIMLAGLASALGGGVQVLWALLPPALAFLGLGALRQLQPRWRALLARGVVWSGVVQALVALTFYDPKGRPASFALLEQGEGRYQWLGTMGNPADVASFLVLPTVLSWDGFLRRRRFWWLLAALVQSGVLLATQTLSALVALLAGGGLMFFLYLPRHRRLKAAGALVVAVVLVLLGVPPLRQRLELAWEQVQSWGWMWVASARGAAWTAALRMVASHPLVGVGFQQFEAHSFSFLTAEELADRGLVLGMETGFGEAHNELLQFVAETGLLGLAFIAFGVFLALRSVGRAEDVAHRRMEKAGSQSAPPLVAHWAPLLTAAGTLAMLQFPLQLAAIAGQWLVVAALLLPPLAATPPIRGVRIGVAVALVVGAGWGSYGQWRAYRAVQSAEVLVTWLREKPRDRQAQELASAAYQGLRRKLAYLPWDYRAETTAGNLAREAGNWVEALGHFRRALALAERPETRFNVGVVLWVLGQEEEALAHLARAVMLNPAVLKTVTEPDLAQRLSRKLEVEGYFARVPWARTWLGH